MVYTDHRNLEYLWEAKRLNPRQARWPTSLPDSSSPSDTVVPGLGHRGCQCLWSYSAGVSPDPHLYPSQSKDLLNSYSAYFPGHWSSCDQSNSLTATRSLLVAGNGQRHQKVCERVPGMCHGKDTPPLTIWKVPSSPPFLCVHGHT